MNGIVIKTERLILKPMGTADLETANSYSLDEQNTRFMCFLPNRDSEETLQFLKNVESEWQKEYPGFYEFAVYYRETHIGAVSVYFDDGIGELGWIINRRYWGNGFAYEAAKAMIDYFTSIGHHRFVAHCDTENTPSYRLMEKLGMTRTSECAGRKNRSSDQESREYQYELTL